MIGQNFDNESIRKATVAFGALFNEITLLKKDVDKNEIKRIKVPLAYGSKEKYLARIREDALNKRPTQLALPRMQFSLVDYAYDPERKQQTMLRNRSATAGNPQKLSTQFVPVPYDLIFQLQILTREVSDGLQILGMILPYFTPDYTVNVVFSPDVGEQANKDTPIILNGTQFEDNVEGPIDEVRLNVWTLTFTMKSYVFGPSREQSQIKKVIVNFYNDGLTPSPVYINGQLVTANTTRGMNTFITSANVATLLNTNSTILINGSTVKIREIDDTVVTGNVVFSTTEQNITVLSNNPSSQMVTRYTAEVVPNTATIYDNYVITEMFEDFI